jgi:putative hydrolase of the HAD superfamily
MDCVHPDLQFITLKITELEKTGWNDLVYLGDNPNKDFINLRKLGANTVRIRQ